MCGSTERVGTALDDIGIAIGDIPIIDVAEERLVGGQAASPEIPLPQVHGFRDLDKPESGKMINVGWR